MAVSNFILRTGLKAAVLAAAVCLVAPVGTPQAYAQDESGSDDSDRIEEIVVTARKREESLLEIPLAISAFSAERIEDLGISRMSDIVEFSPGFHYAENSVGRGGRFNRRLIFRGMNPRTDIQTRQGATVFIDGAPILGSEIGRVENYERIEVIKGPQSAYFGRSTFSGAINAITRTPGNEWAARVTAEAGSFGTSDFSAQIEGPLVQDRLSFRLSGSTYDTDGEYRNAGNPSQRLGAESTKDLSLSVFATPTDNFSAKFRARGWQDDDEHSIGLALHVLDNPDVFNCEPGGRAAYGRWICGKVPYVGAGFLAPDATLTPQLRADFYNPTILEAYPFKPKKGFGLERNALELSLVLDWELANGMTLSSITAAHENEYMSFEDVDRRPTVGEIGFLFGFPGSADSYQFTMVDLQDRYQELRLSSAADQRLSWLVGFSYSKMKYRAGGAAKLHGFPPNPQTTTYDPETTAVFGSINWAISDQLEVSVEARNQWDKVVEGTLGNPPLKETFDSFSPRVILDWSPRDNTTFYVSYAQGYNPGQFNARVAGRSPAELAQIEAAATGGAGIIVEEEEIISYEIGAKSAFWDGRGQVSAAAYFADWKGIVAPEIVAIVNDAGDTEQIQVNATGGQADLSGFELEAWAIVTDNLTLEATLSLTKSKIKKFDSPDALSLLGNRKLDGLDNEFSRYPELAYTLSGTYSGQFLNDYDWYARGDYIYRGSTWLSNANITETGSSSTFNLRIGVEVNSWRIEGYALNLFKEKGYTNLQRLFDLSGQTGFFGGVQVAAGLIPKRSFGVRATFDL